LLIKTRSRAFTLLELIVVIVILALLAALAIPTFSQVTIRTKDQVSLTGLEAAAREAIAIASFKGIDEAELEAGLRAAGSSAAASAGAPAATGLGAAGISQIRSVVHDGGSDLSSPSTRYGYFSASVDGEVIKLAMISMHSPHCVSAVYEGTALVGTGRAALTELNGVCQAADVTTDGEVGSGPVVVTPPVTTPPVSSPDVDPITCPGGDCGSYVVPDDPATRLEADPVYTSPCSTDDDCGQVKDPTGGSGDPVSVGGTTADLYYMGSFAYKAGASSDVIYASRENSNDLVAVTDDLDDDGQAGVRVVASGISGAQGVLVGNNPTKAYAGFRWVADSIYVASPRTDSVYRVDAKTGTKTVVASGFTGGEPLTLTGWACPSDTPVPSGARYATCLYVTTSSGVDVVSLGTDGTGTPRPFITDASIEYSYGIRLMGVNGKLRLWVSRGDAAGASVYDLSGRLVTRTDDSDPGLAYGLEHVGSQVVTGYEGGLLTRADDGAGGSSTLLADADLMASDVHDHGRPGRFYFVDRTSNSLMAMVNGSVETVATGAATGYQAMSASRYDLCAYNASGVDCWRDYTSTSTGDFDPAAASHLSLPGVSDVAVSSKDYSSASRVCAAASGNLYCWDMSSASAPVRVSVPGADGSITKVAIGGQSDSAVVITSSGDAYGCTFNKSCTGLPTDGAVNERPADQQWGQLALSSPAVKAVVVFDDYVYYPSVLTQDGGITRFQGDVGGVLDTDYSVKDEGAGFSDIWLSVVGIGARSADGQLHLGSYYSGDPSKPYALSAGAGEVNASAPWGTAVLGTSSAAGSGGGGESAAGVRSDGILVTHTPWDRSSARPELGPVRQVAVDQSYESVTKLVYLTGDGVLKRLVDPDPVAS
jgi:prepilin-type N-terminal cleavage/methylation domain-containing protein